MGLQVKKRTKGKSGWMNGSYSKKGVGVSGSVKVSKDVTYNTGDVVNGKTPPRLTVNLGNGYKWVSYGKRKKQVYSESTGSLAWVIIAVMFILTSFLLALSNY